MKLFAIDIKNFRSIKEDTLHFPENCLILVGINESGKTNVLHALRLLGKDFNVEEGDLRDLLGDEEWDQESYVRFRFSLSDEDWKGLTSSVCNFALSPPSAPLCEVKGVKKGVNDIIKTFFREGLYKVDIKEKKKFCQYWDLPTTLRRLGIKSSDVKVLPFWKKVNEKCPPDYKTTNKKGEEQVLKNFLFVNVNECAEINPEYLEPLTFDAIFNHLGNKLCGLIEPKIPEVIFWEYSKEFLLPASINIEKFSADSNSSIPLKNVFELCGINDISSAVAKAKVRPNGFDLLATRISKRTTAHIKKIWPGNPVKVEVLRDGDNFSIAIRDTENRYNFERRSDGFKRFVTFIIMISARVRTRSLDNALIIIDEPEIGLYPVGVKHILNELIDLSKSNKIVFATHSIFMIDAKTINRHIIVEKDKEISILKYVNESNFFDAEILFNALGSSTFEVLKEKNIIFEGWTDKKLFAVALEKKNPEFRKLKRKFEKIGKCFSIGASRLSNIASILQLANRVCFILSDDDDAAKSNQKKHLQGKGHGTWKRYSEILGQTQAITAEDFVKTQYILKRWKEFRKTDSKLVELKENDFSQVSIGKAEVIKRTIHASDVDDKKETIRKFKKDMFENITVKDIEDEYFELVKKIDSYF